MRNFSIAIMVACAFSLCVAEIASAQGRGGGGFGRGTTGWLGLLRMESVQTEIELVDDQLDEIESLQEEMWESMQQEMRSLRDLPSEERRERFSDLRTQMQERQEEYQEKIEGVLLPMQVKRIEELHVQSQFRRYGNGAFGLLRNSDMLEQLGIDEDTKKKMEEKAEEVKKELDEKIAELRKKAEDKVLSVLSKDQRKMFREKVGETFDFGDANDPGLRRGGGRGDRGGRDRGSRPDRD